MKSYRILMEGYSQSSFDIFQKWKKNRPNLCRIPMPMEYESLPTTDWKEFRGIKSYVVLIENIYYGLNTSCIKFIEGSAKKCLSRTGKICKPSSSLSEVIMPKMGVIREISRSLTEEGTDNSLYNCNMPTHPSFPSEKILERSSVSKQS